MTLPDAPDDHERGHSRRQQVLDAAADCFRHHGFHGSSIARIGQVAGMSPGHIYHYFHNKEAIVAGIVEHRMAELFDMAARTRELSRAGDPLGAFMALVDEGVRLRADPERAALDLEIIAEGARNPEIGAMLERAAAALFAEMRQQFAEIPALSGLGAAEVDARIHILGAMFDGLAMRSTFYRSLDRDAIARVMKRMVGTLLQE